MCIVTALSNPNSDIWRSKYPWLVLEWRTCQLYTHTRGTKLLYICCTSVLESQISVRFRLWAAFFSYRYQDMISKWHICVTGVPESQMSFCFALQPAIFELQAALRQMTSNTTRPKLLAPHVHLSSVPGPQISLRFTLCPVGLELQGIFRQVHRMTPISPWILQGQKHPI